MSFATARVAPEKRVHPAPAVAFLTGGRKVIDMATIPWGEQYKHPNWQKRRLERMEAAGWECMNCGDKGTTFNVHHKRYVKGRNVWEYDDDELVVLCEPCHEEEHVISDDLKELLVYVDNTEALALIKGFRHADDWYDQWIGDSGRDRNPRVWALGIAAMILGGLPPKKLIEAMDHAVGLMHPDKEHGLHWRHKYRAVFEEVVV
jgi:hypothetical protein